MTTLFKKKTNFRILKVLIILSTYSFVIYKIYNSVESSQFILDNFSLSIAKSGILIIVLLLMIVNWVFEAVKWKILVKDIKRINLKYSLRSVLAGISIGIFTPNRIGEFAGRPYFTDSSKMVSGVFASIVGSLSQSFITITVGVFAINAYLIDTENKLFISKYYIYLILTLSILLIILIAYAFFKPSFLIKLKNKFGLLKKKEKELHFLKFYKFKDLRNILTFSFFRYTIFFTQFYLLLIFFNIEISVFHALIAIGLIYLFLFIIPGFALSEIGVRGSLAIFFLGLYSSDYPAILSASILLWIVNLAFPAILGTFIVMREPLKKNLSRKG